MSLRLGMGLGMIPASARPVPTTAPVNTVAPSITGIQTQGQTVTANPGSWDGLPSGAFAYQWKRGATNVGTNSQTYTLVSGDVGQSITVVVTATNDIGSTPATSAAIVPAATLTISGGVPSGSVGSPYTYTPTTAGGHTPKTFALTGTLPAGLSFSPSTGAITGTPTSSGTASSLNITVTDADGLTASLGAFSLTIASATSSTITLARDYFIHGASSGRGNQDSSGVTIFQDASHQIDAATADSTETASGGSQPVHTVSNGKKMHNRAVSGDGYSAIETKVAAQAADFASTDMAFLHIGDNGITPDTAGADLTLYNSHATIAASVGIGSRPYVQCVNTRGGFRTSDSQITELVGSYYPTMKELLFRRLHAIHPGKVLDFFHTLQNHANDYGLQDVTNDQNDLDKGYSPRGFMLSDGSHMDQDGYKTVSRYAVVPVIDAVEGGTPFALRQFITPVRPTSPAAGDVMGDIVMYGSGGSCSLAASNTQTDHAVASNGRITRVGTGLQTRDLNKVHTQFDKSGRPNRVQKHIMVGELAGAANAGMVEFDGYSHISQLVTHGLASPRLLIVARLDRAPGTDGTQQALWPGTFFRTGNTIDSTVFCTSGTNVGTSLINMTSGGLFTVANPPRWFIASVDIPNGIVKGGTFTTPTSYTAITNNASATTRLQADTSQTIGIGKFAFGHSQAGLSSGNLGTKLGNFRLNDFYVAPYYRDPALQATRELFADSSGNPTAAMFSADGAIDGMTPWIYARGTATDWRMCNFKGSDAGDYGFHHWKNPSTGEAGYLVNA